MPTCSCGRSVADRSGANGHVRWTDGEVGDVDHGPKGTVPDGWEALFDGLDDEPEPDPPADDDADEPEPDPPATDEGDDGPGLGERLRLALTDDVRHLWGGAP